MFWVAKFQREGLEIEEQQYERGLGRVLINPSCCARLCARLLLGGKRTSLIRSLMSVNDPKRT